MVLKTQPSLLLGRSGQNRNYSTLGDFLDFTRWGIFKKIKQEDKRCSTRRNFLFYKLAGVLVHVVVTGSSWLGLSCILDLSF